VSASSDIKERSLRALLIDVVSDDREKVVVSRFIDWTVTFAPMSFSRLKY